MLQPAVAVFSALAVFLAAGLALGQGIVGQGHYTDIGELAGVTAVHRGLWDPEGSHQGYLAVGQAWGDYDGDGWLDLYVTGNLADNVLYRNLGDGTFAVSPLSRQVALAGVKSGGAVWADYDNDGWRDLYVANHGPNALFHNIGGERFVDVTESAGVGDDGKGTSAAWGDYDNDGFLDLYVVNWSCQPECEPEEPGESSDRLYRNNGDGTFDDQTARLLPSKLRGAGFAASFVDYDGDSDLDLYVVNDKVRHPIGNVLWRNDGEGCGAWCWTDVSAQAGADSVVHGMGLAVGDYDNDGRADFYVSNMMGPMVLLRNSGAGFEDATWEAGVAINPPGTAVGWGAAFFDYDNDGWADLYLAATGMPKLSGSFYGGKKPDMEDFRNPYPDSLFRNNGDGSFSEVGGDVLPGGGRPTMGLAYADYDNDGDIDLVLGNWNEGYTIFRNDGLGAGNNWLAIRLEGGGKVNRDAVGVKAYVTTSDGRVLYQQVIAGSSFGSGNDTTLHFGLGSATVEQVRLVWPDASEEIIAEVGVNRLLNVSYRK
jgi:hypothetical protein